MERVVQKLKDFNELVMFQHSIFSLPFIFIAMVVAAGGWFGWKLLLLGVLAAVTARNFAMGLNRYADRAYDAQNPRTMNRPSVDGRLDAPSIALFTAVNALVFVGVAYMINDLAFKLSVPILAVLASYSYFKRFSAMAHIVLGVSLGLAPIAGVVAVDAAIPVWAVLLSVGVIFWVAGFDLLYSLQDIEYDRSVGLFSIPSRYGAEATLLIALIFHIVTVLFWAFFVWVAGLGAAAWTAIAVSAVMLAYEHRLVRKDFTKIDRAFFTVNGYLGIVFFVLIVIDREYLMSVRLVSAPLDICFEPAALDSEAYEREYHQLSETDEDPITQWLKRAKAKGDTAESDPVMLNLMVELHRKIDNLERLIKNEEPSRVPLASEAAVEGIGYQHFRLKEALFKPGEYYYGRIDMPVYPRRDIGVFFRAEDARLARIEKIHERDEKEWAAYLTARERVMIREMKGNE